MPRISELSDYDMRGLNGHRPLVRHEGYDGKTNISIIALSAMGKPADLGQFPEQPNDTENAEIKNILSSLDINDGSTMYDNVLITPAYMEFKDASEGMTFRQSITIRNIGKVPAFVRICQPNSMALKIKTLDKSMMLSPGLALTRKVTYSFKRPALVHATIPIEINDHLIDYHIVCLLSTEYIEIDPVSIDFDIVDVGCSSATKIINIENAGGKSTRFTVDLGKNDLEINVRPYRGIVRPDSKVHLHVEMIGIREGIFYSEFWIKSNPNIRVPIKVKVIIPRLVIYYPNTTGDFTLVDFSPTFVDTQKYDTFVLRNMSSQCSSFVVLGEIDNELVPIKDIDTNVHLAYSVFKINPVEGRLDPFQGTIFEIEFSPTKDVIRKSTDDRRKRINHNENVQDFMAFVRILRVHARETQDMNKPEMRSEPSADFPRQQKLHLQEDAESNSSVENENSGSSMDQTNVEPVRVCIHGEAEIAVLNFVPDELHLENFESGSVENRVLRIENPSKNTSLTFRFVANGSAHCEPSEGFLQPGKSREVLMKIGGEKVKYVESKVKLAFNVFVKSHSEHKSGRLIDVKVSTYSVNCNVKCGYMKTKKSPILSNPIDYCLPEKSNHELCECEIIRRKNARKYWANYLRTFQTRKRIQIESEKLKDTVEGCEVLEKIISNSCEVFPKIEKIDTLFADIGFCANTKMTMRFKGMKKEKTLIPLSPLQIYNVKISPTMFTFGSVVTKSINFQELLLENRNNFPIMIRLISLSSKNIRFPTGSRTILEPGSLVKKVVEFRADQIGKFNSYIDYVINDNHSFELVITADVVYKSLTLGARELVLGSEDEYLAEECYRPLAGYIEVKNKLNARTNFKWDVTSSASYKVDPLAGCVRGKRSLFVSVSYLPDIDKTHNTEVTIKTEGGTYMTLKLNTLGIGSRRPDVSFLNEKLNIGSIPLNVPYTAVGVLHNAEYCEIIFEIDENSLISRDLKIYPRRGIIPPRGIAPIEIVLRFDVCLDFTLSIRVLIEKYYETRLQLMGQVSFPMLKMEPDKIEIKRISAAASQIHRIAVTNFGKTLITLRFILDDYPEFQVSLSNPSIANINGANFEDSSELEREGIIVLPAGDTRFFHLHFTPIDLASYTFYLPFIINEILGPVIMENPKSLKPEEYLTNNEQTWIDLGSSSNVINIVKPTQSIPTIFIDCTVAGHVISFNKLNFTFDKILGEVQDVLRIFNTTNDDTSFIIRIDQLMEEKDCPFDIRWESGAKIELTEVSIIGILEPEMETHLRITFDPKQRRGDFSVEAPIFVRGQLDGAMFNKLKLEGRNPKSRIDSDTREIYLSPIPLKVETEEKFEIFLRHFTKKSTITATIMAPDRLVGEFRNDLLKITFPSGNAVEAHPKCSSDNESMQVCIIFRSERPISFRTKIQFTDAENEANFIITIFGTADNCLLTIHAFPLSAASGASRSTEFEQFQQSSHQSLESEISDNCSLEKQSSSGRIKKRFGEMNPRLSVHSNVSQSNWNAARILNSIRFNKRRTETMFGDLVENAESKKEDDLEVEITPFLKACSGISVVSPPPQSKFHRISRLNYPLFPIHPRDSVYEQHMHRVMKAAEEWLYSSPLGYQFYPNVTDGITAFLSNLCTVGSMAIDKRKSHSVNQSFIDILVAIVGPEIYDFIGKPSVLPENDVERIVLVMKIYENILNFLVAQGACLCHVSARYLLNYRDYAITLDDAHLTSSSTQVWFGNDLPHSDRMDSHLYYEARSMQCWLDVILQTFKSLVLGRINADGLRVTRFSDNAVLRSTDMTHFGSTISLLHPLTDAAVISIKNRARASENYSEQESLLLAWMDHHYEQQRREDWLTDNGSGIVQNSLDGKEELPGRTITNFEQDLADGLVFIAVTVAYCPFLIEEFFRNIYIHPRSSEEALHNAICVTTAWQKIRLDFIITPRELIQPNSVQMLMLVVHLFVTLPTYLPRTRIKFSCPLTETVTRTLNFTNSTDSRVTYVLQFFGNNSAFFNAVQMEKIFRLNMRDSGSIKIQFHARKIQKTRAYLVLCGSSIGPTLAINQCFLLEGEASHLGIANEYKIKSKLYKVVDKILNIQAPYNFATEYEIWMTEEAPTNPGTIKMEQWSELRLRKVPRRLFINQVSIEVVEEKSHAADLSITVGCIAPNTRNFWIIFQSKLGDFIIQIISSSQTSITDHITVNWVRERCICADPSTNIVRTCPLNISVGIPSRNTHLWNCVSQMFQKSLNPKERIFWARHLETNVGLRLIHWLMGDHADSGAKEFMHIFDSSVTYNVSVSDKSRLLVVPEKFIISDVKPAEDETEMKIHVDELTPQVYEAALSLASLDKRENRRYNIDLLCEDPPTKIAGYDL